MSAPARCVTTRAEVVAGRGRAPIVAAMSGRHVPVSVTTPDDATAAGTPVTLRIRVAGGEFEATATGAAS